MAQTHTRTLSDSLAGSVLGWRKKQKLTQHQLANRSGISRSSIARLELGLAGPRSATIDALAKAMGISPVELLEGPPPEEKRKAGRGGR